LKNKFKYYKHKLSLFFSILFLFQLVLFNTDNTVFAATTSSVSYTITGEAKVGNIITIAVNVANVTNLYGRSIDFVYDSNLIVVQSVTKGNIFDSNEVLTPIGSNGKIKNRQASFAISMKGNKISINLSSNGASKL
jgi:hypothetical protein